MRYDPRQPGERSFGTESTVKSMCTVEAVGKVRRFWEVDVARGVALLMMALYHTLYDLQSFGGYAIEATSGFWARFADATAFSFLFLVGVSLAIRYSREEERQPGGSTFGKYLRRGLKVLGYGMILTLVSWSLGIGVIIFGILHLIGVSIILAYPFLRFRLVNLILAIPLIALGIYIQVNGVYTSGPWLLPLGILPNSPIFMPDYRPLLPWFGVVLLGLFVGKVVYGNRKRERGSASAPRPAGPLAFLGRNSLLFYFVHQPVIIATLILFGIIKLGSL
ncbi:MAG: heparan-alpha-glucosaminide N-acetyltransferase [Rubrobacteraceae bacterium]